MQMLDKVKKNYSPLVPQDMTDELFWEDGLSPNDERSGYQMAQGVGLTFMSKCKSRILVHITKVTKLAFLRHRHPAPVHFDLKESGVILNATGKQPLEVTYMNPLVMCIR